MLGGRDYAKCSAYARNLWVVKKEHKAKCNLSYKAKGRSSLLGCIFHQAPLAAYRCQFAGL